MPPQINPIQLPDGTRFIVHATAEERFIFEAKGGHILSISIQSPSIGYYRDVLVGEVYKRSELTHARHDAVHNVGMTYSNFHEHFESRRNSEYDGIQMMAYLVSRIGATDSLQVVHLAQSTAN